MRYAGNFHPEWGYLAPAPNFMRTARVILVATAIGATAGAGVVFSLVGRADTETSVAARTLARSTDGDSAQVNTPQPAPASPTLGAARAPARATEGASAQLNAPQPAPAAPAVVAHDAAVAHDHAAKSLAADAPRAGAADSESKPMSTTMAPAGIAALAEVPAVNGDASAHPATLPSAAAPSTAPQAKLAASTPAASAPSAAAAPPTKAAASPPAATSTSAAQAALAQQKWAAAKKRVAPRFATRGGSSRIAPGQYYMSANSYENRGRSAYYRENGWSGGYYQAGGGRFQDW